MSPARAPGSSRPEAQPLPGPLCPGNARRSWSRSDAHKGDPQLSGAGARGGLGGRALLILAAGIALSAITIASGWRESYLSNDAAQYLSEARNIGAGRGLTTSIVYYDEHYRIGGIPVPQTVFPPGYPALIAFTHLLGVPERRAAFLLCLLALEAVALEIALVSRRTGASRELALVLALSWLLTAAAAWNVRLLNSEMPFVACTLLALPGLLEEGRVGAAALSGVALAAAIAIRYQGLFLLGSVALSLALRFLWTGRRAILRTLVAFVPVPVAVVALLFLRNARLVGDLKGGNNYALHKGIAEASRVLARVALEDLGLSIRDLPLSVGASVLALLLGSLALLAFGPSRLRFEKGTLQRLAARPLFGIGILYACLSLAALVWLEATTSVGLDGRMLLPLAPFLLLLASEASQAIVPPRPSALAWAPLVALFLMGQAVVALQPAEEAKQRHRHEVVAGALARVRPLLLGTPLLADQPQITGEILETPVVGLTTAWFSGKEWSPARVESVVRTYGASTVVFYPRLYSESDPVGRANQGFFDALAEGRVPAFLDEVYADPDVRLYRVKEEGS